MGCQLGFDNEKIGESRLITVNLYNIVHGEGGLKKLIEEDEKKRTSSRNGPPYITIHSNLRTLEYEAIECKGWYREEKSANVLQKGCAGCKYRADNS